MKDEVERVSGNADLFNPPLSTSPAQLMVLALATEGICGTIGFFQVDGSTTVAHRNCEMNWLAHLLLTGPCPAARLGGILPDMASRAELASMPDEFHPGIALHYRIDAFTDRHEVVRTGIRRLDPGMRRFGGILVDMFYDHFLAAAWEDHSEQPLDQFVSDVYDTFERYRGVVPISAMECLDRMREGDWLGSYRTVDGVRIALDRIGGRLRRPMPLGIGAGQLEEHYDAFRSDFKVFFPELQNLAGVRRTRASIS